MFKRGAVLCVLAAAFAVLASSSSASAGGSACTLTAAYKALLVYLHAPTTPPTQATTTSYTGDKGTQCNSGPVSVQQYPNVSKANMAKMVEHEAKPGRGPCSRNYQERGSNTVVKTNAKTNQSTQKTYGTAIDVCEKGTSVDEIVATLQNASQYQHAESLEGPIMEALSK